MRAQKKVPHSLSFGFLGKRERPPLRRAGPGGNDGPLTIARGIGGPRENSGHRMAHLDQLGPKVL